MRLIVYQSKMESKLVDFRDFHDQQTLLHAKVEILTSDKSKLEGYVYTIDPITHSIVLYSNKHLTLVFMHAIMAVKIMGYPDQATKDMLDSLLSEPDIAIDDATLSKKKKKLVDWLTKNRLEVEVNDDVINVGKCLDILPPYGHENCQATNEIILTRIQTLIKAMDQK